MKMTDLISILTNAANSSAAAALRSAGIDSGELSKSQAYKRYGRANVDRWLREKLITIKNKKFNALELNAIAAASNRVTYLPVAER
jgi:hypothetical protein